MVRGLTPHSEEREKLPILRIEKYATHEKVALTLLIQLFERVHKAFAEVELDGFDKTKFYANLTPNILFSKHPISPITDGQWKRIMKDQCGEQWGGLNLTFSLLDKFYA